MTSKYKLKPGNHQFAPGSPAKHNNFTLTDIEAKWYLERYPHIAALFEVNPQVDAEPANFALPKKRKRANRHKAKIIATSRESDTIKPFHEDLFTTN